MNSRTTAVILSSLGVVVRACSYIYSYITFVSNLSGSVLLAVVGRASSDTTFETLGTPGDFLGMQLDATRSHFMLAFAGTLALVGGIALLVGIRERGLTDVAASQPSGAVLIGSGNSKRKGESNHDVRTDSAQSR